jgi:hypothetical protein
MNELKDTSLSGSDSRQSRRTVLGAFGLAAAAAAVSTPVTALAANPGPLKSAGVLAFGPDNVLFVGDITGAAVHAFALRDTDLTSQQDVELGNFHNFEGRDLVRGLDQKLAALFGTTYDQIVINDWSCISPHNRSSFRLNGVEARMRFQRL